MHMASAPTLDERIEGNKSDARSSFLFRAEICICAGGQMRHSRERGSKSNAASPTSAMQILE